MKVPYEWTSETTLLIEHGALNSLALFALPFVTSFKVTFWDDDRFEVTLTQRHVRGFNPESFLLEWRHQHDVIRSGLKKDYERQGCDFVCCFSSTPRRAASDIYVDR